MRPVAAITRPAANRIAALQMHAIAVPCFLDRGHVGIHAEIDAAIAHGLGQAVAEIHVEVA